MSVVILQDEIVHFEVLGRGRPLVFLHGWVGSWRYWIPNMQAASIGFRAYAIDLWGFGDTAKESSRYFLEHQSNLIDSFMDKMGIGKIALVGHGLGAIVALKFAADHSQFVDRVLAISCPLGENPITPRFRTSSPGDLADWLLNKAPDSEAARVEAPKADSQALYTSLDELKKLNIYELIYQINTPCLFVHGQNDNAVAPPSLDEVALLPEHTHFVSFDQSGHFPMLDENNKFNRLLTDFLSLTSGESPRQLQLKEEWKRRVR
jgi:pimeloyl-ACP methyl ester carboxylesterase